MATASQIMKQLEKKGNAQTRKTFERHGASGDVFGVRVSDLKVIAKTIKGDQELACELYDTGNYDAMYLAGMVADGGQMTKKQLESWARKASWQWISEYTVPWVAAESAHGHALAVKWIGAKKEAIAAGGWNTYAGLVTMTPDDGLDLKEIKSLLKRIEKDLDDAPNRVRYTMNGFVIAVGSSVAPLAKQAMATAKKLGKVDVDMGGTACKVPLATEYIEKFRKSGRAKKRKTTRC
ncbi:MAG: DNA alkylation repair protein [Planctomycetes bacterium]|nr:DNA alkylation repair protein [Planctomycetota bacterium]